MFDPYETLAERNRRDAAADVAIVRRASGDTGYFWSAYDAVKHIREGTEWATNVENNKKFVSDIAAGRLANVTWITPAFGGSDHPGSKSVHGPVWVTSLVNAIGKSPFWFNTAIFITWDDWGGWYDRVPPPVLDFDGLGIRTPLLVISPYAIPNTVAHTQYGPEASSVSSSKRLGCSP